jgi:hypothetical protein
VQVWQLAADSRYEMAGLPALAIVLAAMIPVVLLFRGDVDDVPGPHEVEALDAADVVLPAGRPEQTALR